MRFTAQEEYGLRCLLQVAREPSGFLTIPQVARRERLTRSYVAKLFTLLRRAGLLGSVQGKAGGFRLSRPPEQIDVGTALGALDAPLYCKEFCDRHTGREARCVHDDDCPIRALWSRLHELVVDTLGRTTLKDLLRSEGGMSRWLDRALVRRPSFTATSRRVGRA